MRELSTEVRTLMTADNGHAFDHVERVLALALAFAEKEGADKDIIELACLVHDVDDYKLADPESVKNLSNARRLLGQFSVNTDTQERVIEIVGTMGYNKSLDGIRPATLEGQIVSDADMCDSLGSQGILRTYAYNASRGLPFFNTTLAPQMRELSGENYRNNQTNHAVQHFFDKLLKISLMMMTESGKTEGAKRQEIMVSFLRELFREENAPEWEAFLDKFLETN
jgi:uncharacterized protein